MGIENFNENYWEIKTRMLGQKLILDILLPVIDLLKIFFTNSDIHYPTYVML